MVCGRGFAASRTPTGGLRHASCRAGEVSLGLAARRGFAASSGSLQFSCLRGG
jgi:hypothetical protein